MLTAFFVTAVLGRVGIAMTPLALLWLVHERTGSFATAGLATAGLAVAEGVAGPQTARLADRFGQPRVLQFLAAAQALALWALVAGTSPASAPAGVFALGAGVGASLPQLGAFTAARWSHRLTPATGLSRAFGLEAVANSTAFLLGPVLVATLATHGRTCTAVVAAGVLVVGGTSGLALLRASAPPPAAGDRGVLGLPRAVGLPLAVNVCVGMHFGALPLAVTASVVATGDPQVATALFAASSAGGLLAGLVLTHRRRPVALRPASRALAVAGLALLLPWPTAALAVVLFAVGAAVPPVVVAASVRARRDCPPRLLTSTFAWLASVSAAGSAASSAVAGAGVEAAGPVSAFVLAGLAATGAAVCEKITR
ncbi:MFS transporter [Kineococcus sp. SYSU DK003]|uniref:MFS transporter n=1 Tax=Kineococcus sp. SYSU DK003 TaxID=3383124 RepID=UPI003D7E5C6D